MSSRSRLAGWASALTVTSAVVVYTVTASELVANICYLGVLVGASIAAWVGAARAPRGRRLVPCLVAAGISSSALGDVLWSVVDSLGSDTDVSIADPAWFASYVLLSAAVGVVLSRSRRDGRVDPGFVVDALTIVVVSVLVFWRVSVGTIVADSEVSPLVRAVWAAYPILDAVLLALVVRVLLSRRARAAIDVWFAVGVCLWLAADVAYLQMPDEGTAGTLMDAAWMVAPVLMARSAWRYRETEPESATHDTLAPGGWVAQVLVAVCPLFVPPVLELISDLRGQPDQSWQLLIGVATVSVLAFVRIGRLIRSEERAHRELEVARDAALAASEAKSIFLATMSHEIRTPLTTVLATGEMLEDTRLDDTQVTLVHRMHRAGTRLMSLVDGILDFSRVEAGQADLQTVEFDLPELVRDTTDGYFAQATQQGIRFECDLHPDLPRVVLGDPTLVFQVVSNLVDNALKFTPQGRVTLAVRPASGEGRVVQFTVTDTGIGIPEEEQASVFDSFSQVDGSITRRYGGSGLGLAICQQLTELMDGTISLESEPGVGSTFTVCLPLRAVSGATGDHLDGTLADTGVEQSPGALLGGRPRA